MRNSYHALIVKIFREFWSRLRLNAEANARCLDTACRLSDTWAKIYCGYHTIGGNASAEIKAIADLWYPYTSSQQVGTIDSDATTPIIKVDFTEPGMCIPIYQISRCAWSHHSIHCCLSVRDLTQSRPGRAVIRLDARGAR